MVEAAVDEHKAVKDARGVIAEIYQTIGRGKTDSLFSLVTDPLIVFGPRRIDATASRSDALIALGKVVDPKAKKHAQLRSGGAAVTASEGGHSAWAFDVVNLDGQPHAVTAILSNTDDLWAVTAVAIAATPSARQVKSEATRDAIVPPGAAAAGKIDPGAADAVERFKSGLLDQQRWGDDLSSQSDAILVGPTAGEVARGKAAITRQWKARMKSSVREAAIGELAASRTADGQLVWISVPVTRVAGDEAPLPLRIFAVYDKDGSGWKLIALHEAVAIDEPGSGAAFKKILPPTPAPPEPAKTVADKKPDDPGAAHKKPKPRSKLKPRKPKPPPKDDD